MTKKGIEQKELVEWDEFTQIQNAITSRGRYSIERLRGMDNEFTEITEKDSKDIVRHRVQIYDADIQHIELTPHLRYILLKSEVIIIYLPDIDEMIVRSIKAKI